MSIVKASFSETARLTFSSTDHSSDAYYIAGMRVSDAFIGLEFKDKFYAVASSLELGNFQKYSRCAKVFSSEELAIPQPPSQGRGNDRGATPQTPPSNPGSKTLSGERSDRPKGGTSTPQLIARAAKKIGARKIQVGSEFPASLFLQLKKIIPVEIAQGPLFPERLIKSTYEQNEIRKANKIISEAFELCAELLHRAKISGKKLLIGSETLTSEYLRTKIQALFLAEGLEPASDLIIAGGAQACDPHCLGSGPLKPHELIIIDLFAPLQKSRYWGDMTRTFLRGQPSDAQIKLVETVFDAQQEAIKSIKPGVDGHRIHAQVEVRFAMNGYKTFNKKKSGYEGFFHGTGHALGLDCHDMGTESPRISRSKNILRVGEVYTVEPGLYYSDIGGCRIEDNGVVTPTGFKLLSKAPYGWVI